MILDVWMLLTVYFIDIQVYVYHSKHLNGRPKDWVDYSTLKGEFTPLTKNKEPLLKGCFPTSFAFLTVEFLKGKFTQKCCYHLLTSSNPQYNIISSVGNVCHFSTSSMKFFLMYVSNFV